METLATVNTFNVTFKSSNKFQMKIMKMIRARPNDIHIISEELLPDTRNLLSTDPVFKKMIKEKKDLKLKVSEYVKKHNK